MWILSPENYCISRKTWVTWSNHYATISELWAPKTLKMLAILRAEAWPQLLIKISVFILTSFRVFGACLFRNDSKAWLKSENSALFTFTTVTIILWKSEMLVSQVVVFWNNLTRFLCRMGYLDFWNKLFFFSFFTMSERLHRIYKSHPTISLRFSNYRISLSECS